MKNWFEGLQEFEITYNFGFGDRSRRVFAHDVEEAKKVGLIEFRRNTGSVETVDKFSLSEVVADAVPLYK